MCSIHFVQLHPHKKKNLTKPWNTLDTEVQKLCIADKAVLSAPASFSHLAEECFFFYFKKKKVKSPVAISSLWIFGVSTIVLLFLPPCAAL